MDAEKFNESDLDVMTAGMFVFIHGAEMMLRKIVDYYSDRLKRTEDYRNMVRKYGSKAVDAHVDNLVYKKLTGVRGKMLREWMEDAKRLLRTTEHCTDACIMLGKENICDCETFDALMNDTSFICRLFLLCGNIPNEDYIRVESTLKTFGKNQSVRSELVEEFRPKL